MPAVPDPAADGGDPVAGSRPREERVLPDLELPLERAGLLAMRPDVPGGDQPQVGGVDVDERVLIVAVVIARVIASLVDLREDDRAVERERVRVGWEVRPHVERGPFGVEQVQHLRRRPVERHGVTAATVHLRLGRDGIVAVDVGKDRSRGDEQGEDDGGCTRGTFSDGSARAPTGAEPEFRNRRTLQLEHFSSSLAAVPSGPAPR